MTTLKNINGTFTIDSAHSRLGFAARHAMITKVRGNFDEFKGIAQGDGADPSSAHVEITAKAASINTGNEIRDKHLRSDEFFGSDQYPEVKFVSTKISIIDDETLEITGDLTIRDATKEITIPFEFGGQVKDAFGNVRIGFDGAQTISRKEFGLTWNAALEAGGVMVSDKITLEIEISAIKQD